MKQKPKKKIFYHTLSDDLEDDHIETPVIDKNFKYMTKNPFVNAWAWIYYHIIIFPIGWFWCRCIKHIKYVGAKKIRKCKTGYFMYGNHTNRFSDAFSPSVIKPTKKPYLIANPNNVNVPFLGSSTKFLGVLPLPTGLEAHKNFLHAIEHRLNQKHGIVVYPEAKIWTNFTGIRPFDSQSFKYPVKYNVPVFCVTTTYQTTKRNKCQMVLYIDGPFYPDKTLDAKTDQQRLHDIVESTMKTRAKNSNFETFCYQQIQEENQ